jgi:predicted RecA/RadA family phage recombinase
MATNYIQEGCNITVAAPSGGTTSGLAYRIGGLFGVAATTQLINEDVVLITEGVFELTKVGSQAWSVGDVIYWDDGNDRCTTTASGNYEIGVCVEAAGSGAGVVLGKVRLNGRDRAAVGTGTAATFTIALAASATTDGMEVTITAKDGAGTTVAAVHNFEFWFSDAASGLGLTADSFSGALTAPSVGVILNALTAKKHVLAQTAATGIATLLIVDSANPVDVYACVKNPANGAAIVSAASGTNWQGA